MKVHYLGIFDRDVFVQQGTDPVQLIAEKDLNSFGRFTRGSVGEFMTVFSKPLVKKTQPHQRIAVQEEAYTFHAFSRQEGVTGVLISDQEYPNKSAQFVLSKICADFLAKYPKTAWKDAKQDSCPLPELKEYIVKFQNPNEVDPTLKIQQELDETKVVLYKTLESVLERGEKIDNLVQKSDGLSAQSKMFYTQAKKQNSCCTVM